MRLGFPGIEAKSQELAPPVCPLCGSSRGKALFAQRNHTLVACDVCELFFIHPYPKDLCRHHEAVSNYAYEELQVLNATRHYQNEVIFYRRYFDLIDQASSDSTSILDVGCGCGHLLERLRSRPNFYRAGIELNRQRAQVARIAAGCEVLEVPIEDFRSTRRFDVITLMNVLSHVPALDELFEKLRSLLTERGKIVLRTGEMKREVKKSAIFDWEFPDHLQFLGLKTLEYISQRHRLQIQTCLRTALSSELFAPYTWKMKGRSAVRNAIKGSVARVPFSLALLARCYEFVHKESIYSSFVVLRATP
jgi:2-polyprenyl-3-methyl-5-hydroxy-6-metoxy-1,4-benzoquinol methylase